MPARYYANPEKERWAEGNYVAEVLFSSLSSPSWYYIVQRAGSSKVIDLARFDTREQAREAAQQALKRLNVGMSERNGLACLKSS